MSRAFLIETETDLDNIPESDPTAGLLSQLERFVKRYVILPPAAYLPICAWIAATYVSDRFDCFPYLALISPVKRCGKTRLLEVLEFTTNNPWRGTAPSAAALYRMMQDTPTLLLDEVEALKKSGSDGQQELLAILNAGHRRGATVPRCEGPTHRVQHFSVYGPKAFAAIGTLPDTLVDRSIVIPMQRRLPSQHVGRLLWRMVKKEAKPILDALTVFATRYVGQIEAAYDELMRADLPWLSDRDAELWLPLYAVCSLADPSRMDQLRNASECLCGGKADIDEQQSVLLKLLKDLGEIWPGDEQRVETNTLIGRLKRLEESPWGEDDFKLSARKLARLLRPFGLVPVKYDGGKRGHERRALQSAIDRYLEVRTATSATA